MLPDAAHPVWRQFVTGSKPVRSTHATINLLIQNNKMSLARDPSAANVEKLMVRAHDLFAHAESLFPAELTQILK